MAGIELADTWRNLGGLSKLQIQYEYGNFFDKSKAVITFTISAK